MQVSFSSDFSDFTISSEQFSIGAGLQTAVSTSICSMECVVEQYSSFFEQSSFTNFLFNTYSGIKFSSKISVK